jgi:hypothetical protein
MRRRRRRRGGIGHGHGWGLEVVLGLDRWGMDSAVKNRALQLTWTSEGNDHKRLSDFLLCFSFNYYK